MKTIFLFVITVSVVLFVGSVFASPILIGGYDVSKIAVQTLAELKEKAIVSEKSSAELENILEAEHSQDPLVAGSSVVNFYDRLGSYLVEHNLATEENIHAINEVAAKSGGVKIGGANPVVLAASYLNFLVEKGVVKLNSAQTILNNSKK